MSGADATLTIRERSRQAGRHASKLLQLVRENGPTAPLLFAWRRLRRDAKPVRLRINGHALWLRPGTPDLIVANSCFNGEFELFRRFANADEDLLILDCGAYIGASALALSAMYPRAEILAIEPARPNFELLVRNIEGTSNISPLNLAIADSPAQDRVVIRDRQRGEWGYVAESCEGFDQNDTVSAVTIDDLLTKYRNRRRIFVKMDVEGSEYRILKNAKQWISDVDVLMIELHPDLHPDIDVVFRQATHGRHALRTGGEKIISYS